MASKYFDLVANAYSEAKAWRLSTVVLAGVCIALVWGLLSASSNAPVVLVNQETASLQGRIKVTQASDLSGTDLAYFTNIALGDLGMLLTWRPETVEQGYARFLNRTTDGLYAREGTRLRGEAQKHKADNVTQVFYPADTKVDLAKRQAIVTGTLVRWQSDKEIFRGTVRYAVTYERFKGYLHVDRIETVQ
jgi:hypothetical protein